MELESLDESYEPMDIDLSSNSIKNMDVSYCGSDEPEMISRSTSPCAGITLIEPVDKMDSPVPICDNVIKGTQNVKKYHIFMKPNKQGGSKFLVKLSVILVLLVSVLLYHVNTFTCSERIDVQYVKDALSRKLYGQDRAIDLLIRSFDVQASSKILFLYGGTGVGKTYATMLMLKKFWNLPNVYHYVMPSFMDTFPNDLLLGMSFCKSSIFVVDDLYQSDLTVKNHIHSLIEKSEYLKKNVTVILIFNTDNIGRNFMKNTNVAFFEFELREAFSEIEAYKEYIKFEPLKEEHLKMCIKKELGYNSNVGTMEKIMKNFNVTHDGCKGVYTKMKLLNLM